MQSCARIAIAALALSSAGCVPLPAVYTSRQTAHVIGTVRDADTGHPIAGAQIEVTDRYSKKDVAKGTSGMDGSFDVPSNTETHFVYLIYSFPAEFFCQSTVVVHAEGYVSDSQEIMGRRDPNTGCDERKIPREFRLHKQP